MRGNLTRMAPRDAQKPLIPTLVAFRSRLWSKSTQFTNTPEFGQMRVQDASAFSAVTGVGGLAFSEEPSRGAEGPESGRLTLSATVSCTRRGRRCNAPETPTSSSPALWARHLTWQKGPYRCGQVEGLEAETLSCLVGWLLRGDTVMRRDRNRSE